MDFAAALKGIEDKIDKVTHVASDMPAMRTSVDALRAQLDAQERRLVAQEAERQKAAQSVRTPWGDEGRDERLHNRALSPRFSLTAAFQRWLHAKGVKGIAAPNKDALIRAGHFPDAVERAMSGNILTQGGFLIPEEYRDDIIPALLPRTILAQLGVRMLAVGGAGQIRWPKQNSRPTVTAVPEASAATESTPTWQSVVSTPHKAGMLMAIPNEILKYGIASVEAFLQDLFLKELSIEVDTRALRGTGSANQPLGLVNMDSIQNPAVGANGGPITANLILDLITQVEESNTRGTRFGFATSPRGIREIQQIVDGDTRPLFLNAMFSPGLAGARPGTIHGYHVFTTTHIPVNLTKGSGTALTELHFSAWDELLIPMWGDIEIMESKEATDGTNNAFTMDLTLARAFVTYDVIAFHNEALGVINDMDSA